MPYKSKQLSAYHTRKPPKCKYCERPAKSNTVLGRHKGYCATCGSEECLMRNYRLPEVIEKKKHVGEAHPKWIADRSQVKSRPRYENDHWRRAVFERDDYTCQDCGQRGGKLQADHIKPYALYPSQRWKLDNGRTLCVDCHKKTPTYGAGSRKKENHVTLSQ